MTSKRFFFVMLFIIVILMGGALGGAYLANKMLHKEGEALVDLKLQDEVLSKQEIGLQQAIKDIKEYEELEIATKSIVPQDKDQADTIAEIAKLAKDAGFRVGSIEFPESQLGQITKKGSNAKAKTPAAVDSKTTQLTPLDDLKGVYIMEIKVNSHKDTPANYQSIIKLLQGLENNRRTAQVVNIDITPDEEFAGRFDVSISLNTYIRPEV